MGNGPPLLHEHAPPGRARLHKRSERPEKGLLRVVLESGGKRFSSADEAHREELDQERAKVQLAIAIVAIQRWATVR